MPLLILYDNSFSCSLSLLDLLGVKLRLNQCVIRNFSATNDYVDFLCARIYVDIRVRAEGLGGGEAR